MNNNKNIFLTEGRFDKETTEISRLIFPLVKEFAKYGQKSDHFVLDPPFKIKNVKGIYLLMFRYDNSIDEPFDISGAYMPFSDKYPEFYQRIRIDIKFKDRTIEQKHFNNLVFRLKEVIRHELEHSSQNTDRFKHYIKPSTSYLLYIAQEVELEAYVAGLYKMAKTSRQSFYIVLNNFITKVRTRSIMRYKKEIANPQQLDYMIRAMKEALDQVKAELIQEAKRKHFIK